MISRLRRASWASSDLPFCSEKIERKRLRRLLKCVVVRNRSSTCYRLLHFILKISCPHHTTPSRPYSPSSTPCRSWWRCWSVTINASWFTTPGPSYSLRSSIGSSFAAIIWPFAVWWRSWSRRCWIWAAGLSTSHSFIITIRFTKRLGTILRMCSSGMKWAICTQSSVASYSNQIRASAKRLKW